MKQQPFVMKPESILSQRNIRTLLIICVIFISVLFMIYYQSTFRVGNDGLEITTLPDIDLVPATRGSNKNVKVILFWNTFFSESDYGFGFGREPFIKYKCPITKCITTNKRNLMNIEEFDAIIFHSQSFKFNDLPKRRSPHQRYILFAMESVQHVGLKFENLQNFFNWTMTYRYDSDIPYVYGWLANKTEDRIGTLNIPTKWVSKPRNRSFLYNPAQFKIKMAAWFVSNCNTNGKRENLVRELIRNNIPVDIYGGCGPMECPRDEKLHCFEILERDYKFYLSFENSICPDYVTEKFFSVLNYDVIPVVYGGTDYSKIAPPHSYINARDFKSIKDLSNYLILLNKNDTLYNEYFWWKDFYSVRGATRDRVQGFCKVCEMLHDSERKVKWYSNMAEWWRHSKPTCESGTHVLHQFEDYISMQVDGS